MKNKLNILIEHLEKLTGKKVTLKENMFGTTPTKLERNKTYVWTGGAELLDIEYLGPAHEFPDVKPGVKIGQGFLFKFKHDNSYLEMNMVTVRKDIIEKEDLEEAKTTKKPNNQIEINLKPDRKVYEAWEVEDMGKGPYIIRNKVSNSHWKLKLGQKVNFQFSEESKLRPVEFIGWMHDDGRVGVFKFLDTNNTFVGVDALTQGEQIV